MTFLSFLNELLMSRLVKYWLTITNFHLIVLINTARFSYLDLTFKNRREGFCYSESSNNNY